MSGEASFNNEHCKECWFYNHYFCETHCGFYKPPDGGKPHALPETPPGEGASGGVLATRPGAPAGPSGVDLETVKSGNWDDPTVWREGIVPRKPVIETPEGKVISLEEAGQRAMRSVEKYENDWDDYRKEEARRNSAFDEPEAPEGDIDLSSCTFTTQGLRPDPNFLISKHHGKNAGVLVVPPAPEIPEGLPTCVKFDCDCSDRTKDDKCTCPRRDTPDGCEHYVKSPSGDGNKIDVDAGIADEIGKDIHCASGTPEGSYPCPHPSFAVVQFNDNETGLRCAHCFEKLPFFSYNLLEWEAHMRDFKSPAAASGSGAKQSTARPTLESGVSPDPVETAGDCTNCERQNCAKRGYAGAEWCHPIWKSIGTDKCPGGLDFKPWKFDVCPFIKPPILFDDCLHTACELHPLGDMTAGRRWLQRKETGDKVIYDIIKGSGYKWLGKNYKIGPRIEEPSDDEFHEVG